MYHFATIIFPPQEKANSHKEKDSVTVFTPDQCVEITDYYELIVPEFCTFRHLLLMITKNKRVPAEVTTLTLTLCIF